MDKVGRRYRRISHRIQESARRAAAVRRPGAVGQQEVKVYGAQEVELGALRASRPTTHLRLSMKVEVHARFDLLGDGAAAGRGRLGACCCSSPAREAAGRAPDRRRFRGADDGDDRRSSRRCGSSPTCRRCCSAAWPRPSACSRCSTRRTSPTRGTRAARPRARGELEFRDVTARYPGQARAGARRHQLHRAAGHGHRDRRPLGQRQDRR